MTGDASVTDDVLRDEIATRAKLTKMSNPPIRINSSTIASLKKSMTNSRGAAGSRNLSELVI